MKKEKSHIGTQPVVWYRQYGQYQAKVCFATQDDGKVPDNVLDAIMQAYRTRLERVDKSRMASW